MKGGSCPCQRVGGSRTQKSKKNKKSKKVRFSKYAMLCTCKLKRLRTRKQKKLAKNCK